MNLSGFDASLIDPATPRTGPVPPGEYVAEIVHSEEKAVKSGNGGMYLELTFQITEGEHERRKVWSRLNLKNPSERTVAIAQAELSAICRAVGVLRPGPSSDLHHRPLVIKVIQSVGMNGEPINEIKGYLPAGGDVQHEEIAAQAKAPAKPAPPITAQSVFSNRPKASFSKKDMPF